MGFVFALFISVFVYLQITKASVSSYNFSGITNPSGTHVARTFEVDVSFPTNGAPTIDTLTDTGTTGGTPQIRSGILGYALDNEATNDEYTSISASDDNHWTTPNPGFGDMQAFWAQFNIAEDPANITQIDIQLEGHQGGVPQSGRKAWLGVWVPGAPTPYWKTLEAAQKTSDYVYSGTLTTNLDDYIDGSNKLTIIFYNEDEWDSLLIDYVNVDITYSLTVAPPAILSAVIDDPDNGDRKLSAGDTVTITFDKSTNAPAVATKADIDGLIKLPTSTDLDGITYNHIIGADYTGAWSTKTFANDTLTITVTNGIVSLASREVELKKGEVIQIKADGTNDLKDNTGSSDASTSSKVVTGNWGLRPDDDITYASDHNANSQIHEVSLTDEYHYRHATPHQRRGELTYVGYLPISTYAIGRRPSDGYIFAAENNISGIPGSLKLAWMNPELKDDSGTAPDGNPTLIHQRGVVGSLGANSDEYYRLVFTASGILYGSSNDNKLYRVYDSIQPVPAGTHGAADNLGGDHICTMVADPADPAELQLTTNGSADFAFNSEGKLFLISNDIMYWVETGPLVGGIITGPCTAHAINNTTLYNISGLAFTKGGIMHTSTFLPTNRKLVTVDPEDATPSNSANFFPDQDIYDLGSVPKWTNIEIAKSDGGVEFVLGNNYNYTLTVSNAADPFDPNLSDASGPIFVRDMLPEGLTFLSAAGVGWTCDHVGQLIECVNPNDIVKGTSLPVIIIGVNVQDNAVAPDPPYEAPEPIVLNTACVDSTTFEEFDVEDCDTEVTPVGRPQPSITKTPSDAIVNPGQRGLVYTLRLRNIRNITGTGMQVSDPVTEAPLNAFLENLRNITYTNCGHMAKTAIKIRGTELRAGENPAAADINIDGTIISVDIPDGASNNGIASAIESAINTNGTHHAKADENVVTVYHGTPGTGSNGKTIDTSALVAAVNAADVSDDDSKMPALPFALATNVTNNSTATKVIIDDVVLSPYNRSEQECVITYTVDVKGGIVGGVIHNRADVTAPAEGGTAVFAEADVQVSDSPILSTVKTDDDPDNIVNQGQTVTYTLTIDNIGNKTGTGINVNDTLNTNLENLSVTSITNCGASYTDDSTADPPVIDINGVEITTVDNCVIIFTADVKIATMPGTIIPNTAYVSGPLEGGFPTSAFSDDLVVGGSPALVATKTHDKGGNIPPNEVNPLETVTYTLIINNIGDVDGTGITVTDTLDVSFENLNIQSLTNCGPGPNTAGSTANPPVLNVTGVQVVAAINCVIVFDARVKAGTAPGTVIPNTAAVSPAIEGGPGDPDVPSIDLYVPGTINIITTKTDNDADNYVNPSQIITYTITIQNSGDVKLTGIHLLDTLDSDLENLNVTGISNCGSNYFDQSTNNPPELDIRGAGGDPNKGLEVRIGIDCVITFTARVKATAPGFSLIPNVATVTESQEGAPATNPASDVLEVAMPNVTATKADDDADNIVSRGQTITYTIALDNTNIDSAGNPTIGTRSANGVDIYDAMDSDLENLSVISLTNCGGSYTDNSTANPPVIDIDDLIIQTSAGCVITVTADVKNTTPGGSTIPNTVMYSASDEGSPGGAAASDLLIVPIICGDGRLEGGEVCDDGNLINGDGCENDCTLTPAPPPPPTTCGNGILEPGEQCDDGNTVSGDGCSSHCLFEHSGCRENCIPPLPPPPPVSKVCMVYDPKRPLEFNDLIPDSNANKYILALKNTKILKEGDYVVSGNNNHSTGKQQKHFKSGIWSYEPERYTTRLEAVKSILVSNCIPIEDEIPIPADGFRYTDVPVDVPASNELMHFTARVFYTAYKRGIVTASEDGLANPFKDVNLVEVLAIGLRTSSALTKPYISIKSPWYGKYLSFAKDNGILYGINDNPDTLLKRDDFAKILFRIMWYNPRSKVHKYAQSFDFMDLWDKHWRLLKSPAETEEEKEKTEEIKKTDIEDLIGEESLFPAASPESCFAYDTKRGISFPDVPKEHWAYPYIEILRNTKIKNSGDYIASGYGNPSAGKNNEKYGKGLWEFRPYESVNFLELVKVALISNCIPIESMIIPPKDNFQFRQLPWNISPGDEAQYFAARVMYTAYRHGLIKGDIYPFIPISRFQALAILARASEIVPRNYQPKPLPFKDTSDTAWYSPYLSYLYEKGLIKGYEDGTFRGNDDLKRDEMAKFVTLFMRFNQHPDISKYGIYYMNFYEMSE